MGYMVNGSSLGPIVKEREREIERGRNRGRGGRRRLAIAAADAQQGHAAAVGLPTGS